MFKKWKYICKILRAVFTLTVACGKWMKLINSLFKFRGLKLNTKLVPPYQKIYLFINVCNPSNVYFKAA